MEARDCIQSRQTATSAKMQKSNTDADVSASVGIAFLLPAGKTPPGLFVKALSGHSYDDSDDDQQGQYAKHHFGILGGNSRTHPSFLLLTSISDSVAISQERFRRAPGRGPFAFSFSFVI